MRNRWREKRRSRNIVKYLGYYTLYQIVKFSYKLGLIKFKIRIMNYWLNWYTAEIREDNIGSGPQSLDSLKREIKCKLRVLKRGRLRRSPPMDKGYRSKPHLGSSRQGSGESTHGQLLSKGMTQSLTHCPNYGDHRPPLRFVRLWLLAVKRNSHAPAVWRAVQYNVTCLYQCLTAQLILIRYF